MDAMSSLISRRETHDATSDVTKRLAAAVIWHVSVLVDSSENSAIIMYNITQLFSMNYHWYSTSWSVSKTPQKPTLSYTPMHDRWDHLPAGYLLGNAGALIVNLRPTVKKFHGRCIWTRRGQLLARLRVPHKRSFVFQEWLVSNAIAKMERKEGSPCRCMHEVQESNQDGLSCISGVDRLSMALSLEGVASCLRINAAGTLRCLVTCRYFYGVLRVCDMHVVSLLETTVWLHGIDETAPVYLG